MIWLLVVVLVVVAAVAAGAVGVRRRYRASNQVVPGVDTGAPASWAGAHTPEARLHRRLRDAVAAARTITGDDPSLADAKRMLEVAAMSADRRLVAYAALPEATRPDLAAVLADDVAALEAAVVSLTDAQQQALPGPDLQALVASLGQRNAFLIQARAELDAIEGQPRPGTAPGT